MKRLLINLGAGIAYASAYLLCSAAARLFILIVNGAHAVPNSPFDYLVGVFSSVVGGFAGVQVASTILGKWFSSVRQRRIGWILAGLLTVVWIFGLLGITTGADSPSLFVFFTAEMIAMFYATKSLED